MRFCCAERRSRTPARSIDAAIVTKQAYGCNCRSANSNYCHSFAKAYFRRMVGIRRDFRHGMMLAPVASAVPSAEVANLQGSYAAPESTAVAILVKLFRLHSIAHPATAFIHYFFFAPSRTLDKPQTACRRCSGVIRRYAAMSSGSMFSA